MAGAIPAKISYAAYLQAEPRREIKHDYLDGVERAMAGGTIEHARLASRVTGELRAALRDRPCEAFSSDLRIRIESANRSFYPDLTVVCGEIIRAADDPHAIVNPVLIVEVLSDDTEAYDRGEKFRFYKRLPSFLEYVLVSQREPLVEIFRRDGDKWSLTEHGPGTTFRLASIDATLSVDEIYKNPLQT